MNNIFNIFAEFTCDVTVLVHSKVPQVSINTWVVFREWFV